MKVKVGQWLRDTKLNLFFIIEKETTAKIAQNMIKNGLCYIKVANTPQELIQVGDVVLLDFYNNKGLPLLKVEEITKDGFKYYNIVSKCIINVYWKDCKLLEILTPKSNGGYDLQWEETNV